MIRHSGFFQSKYQPNQLLGSVRKRDIVMFALSPFLGEISGTRDLAGIREPMEFLAASRISKAISRL